MDFDFDFDSLDSFDPFMGSGGTDIGLGSLDTSNFDYGSFDGLDPFMGSGGTGMDPGSLDLYSGLSPYYGNFSGFTDQIGDMANGSAAGSSMDTSMLSKVPGQLDAMANYMQTPSGKLMQGFAGAGLSAYGAMRQNKLLKDAEKKRAALLAAAKAKAMRFDEPLHLTNSRTQNAVPTQRNGESLFYSNNRLPSYYAEGGAAKNDPTIIGFLKYLMTRQAAEKPTPDSFEQKVADKRQSLRDASEYGEQPPQEKPVERATGGLGRYVRGATPGQDDKISAQLSDGEYVFDADAVSALGDGNNEAGAKALDAMRQNIRKHKRAAPASKIPPKAKAPEAYLKGAK